MANDDLDQRARAITEQFDAGELSAREFHEAMQPIEAARRQIDREETATEMQQARFLIDAKRFVQKHAAEYGNEVAFNVLDAEVRRLQAKAIENDDDPYDPGILSQAHNNIIAATGHASHGEEAEEEADAVDLDELDELDGTDFEEALATMSPDERDEYLRRA